MESCLFWTLLLRFLLRQTHITHFSFVMILDTFRTSLGEPFGLFGVLLGSLFEVLFFTSSEGNRVTAGNSEYQQEQRERVCVVPKTITSMPSLRARTDPEQVQGSQGPVDKSLIQRYQDHKGTE